MAALEKKLHILRTEVYSLAVASVEPVTAYKFNRDYEENFCCDIDYRQFGYCSLEKFFDDHPQLESVIVEGRRCYRVKVTAECSELRQLVSKQKKKKRKNAPPKSQFQRNYHQRSFAPRGSARQYPNMGPRSSMRGAPSMPFSFSRPPMSLNNGFTEGRTNFGNFGADNNFSANKTTQKRNVGVDPAKGVDRIMQALRKCGGKATHSRLSEAYEQLFRRPIIDDLVIYFGGKSMRIVHDNYLREKANLLYIPGGWMLASKEIAAEREAWNAKNQSVLQKVERTFVWDKPSLAKLYNNVVEMLVNIYPAQLKVDEMSTIYERSYDVGVDPMKLYAKTWKALISTTFREKLEITGNDTVALRAAFVKSRGVTEKRPAATQRAKTAADLGFDSADSEEFDSDDDVSVDSSSVANSSQLTESLPDSPASMSRPDASSIAPPSLSFVSPTSVHTSTSKVQTVNGEVKPVPEATSTKKYPTYFGFARMRPSSQAQTRRSDPVSPIGDAAVPSVTPSPPSGVMPASIGNGLVPAANKYQQNATAFDDTPVNCFGGSRFETSKGFGGAKEGNGVDSFTRAVANRRSANFVLAKPNPSSVFARLSYRKPKEDEQPASSAAQFGKWTQPEVRPRSQEVSAEQKESGTTSTELPQPKKKSGLAGFGSSMKKAISNRLGLTTVRSESSSSVDVNKSESSVSAQPPAESRAPAPAPSQPFQFQVKFKGNREDVRAKLFPAH